MKSLCLVVLFSMLLPVSFAAALAQSSRYDPMPHGAAKQHQSFVEFVFGRINPHNIDYGQRIEDFRFMALTATVGNPDFWSEVVLIGFAGFLLLYALYLQRVQRQMTLSTAELVTSYHNQLAVCEDQLADVSAKYLKLKTELDEEMESSPSARPAQVRSQAVAAGGNDSSSDHAPGPAGPNTSSSAQQQLRDEVAKLKEQISRDGATVISLRQQNVTLSRRVEEEQQKNRRLRGE